MKRTSLLVSSFVLAIILGVGVGCARKPDDAKVSSEIQNKFSQDSGLSTKQLTVQANDGVVTLGGTVDNDIQREAAGRQAASVSGVKTVINNLQVGNASAVAPSPAIGASPAQTVQTSTAPPTDKAKPTPSRKSKSHASERSSAAHNSAPDANDGQMTADNQPAPPSSAQDGTPTAQPDTPTASTPPPPPAPKS